MKRILVLNIIAGLIWFFVFWYPFGIGYYEVPWHRASFRVGIQIWAWLHLAGGIGLARCRWPRKSEARLAAGSLILSGLSLIYMYAWIIRHVSASIKDVD